MYEHLVNWGLKTLTKAGLALRSHKKSLLLEAVKTKNALVLERFRIADQACQSVVDLSVRVEAHLREFQSGLGAEAKAGSTNYLDALKHDFHPTHYREFRKIRTRFDVANDLLSGYSIGLIDWIKIGNITRLCEKRNNSSPSEISRTYRMVWTFLASCLTRTLRITANDLRFWLTDRPYAALALAWARKVDIPRMREFFLCGLDTGEIFFTALETQDGLREFWDDMNRD